MPDANRHRSRMTIAAVFLLLICCACSGLWLASQKHLADAWVRHTFEVSDRLSRLRILNLRSEVYRRNYLLTGKAEDRAAVDSLRRALPQELDALRGMTADNPEQGVRLARLSTLLQERFSASERSMWLRSIGQPTEAIEMLDSRAARVASSRLLRTVLEIEAEEQRLLAARRERANAFERPIQVTFGVSAFLVLLLALLVIRDRRAQMRSLRNANDRLEHDIVRREAAEAQLALLAQNATDAVLRIDLEGMITYASPSTEQVIGVPPEIVVGKSIVTLVHEADKQQVLDFYSELTAGRIERGIVSNRIQKPGKSDVEVWIETNCGLVRNPETGAPVEVIASLRDVSKRKRLEKELDDARSRAEAAASAKSSFLANMSHEIRTPMNGVLGFADLLLNSGLTEEQQRHAQLIVDSGKAMMRLLNDILDISKIEAGQMQIAPERVDLRHALRNCVKLIEPTAAQKGLLVRFDVEPELPPFVLIDGLRLRQVILNLLGNAVKFTEQGSVSLEALRGWHNGRANIEITVADTGIGIPEDRQAAIFEQFVQAEQSTARRFGGTGLGLAISNQLAKLMGGTLDVTSEEGQGTRFTLRVPMVLADSPEAPSRSADAGGEGVARPLRILLAEDHDVNQTLMEAMLARLGHESVTATDGGQALHAVIAAARSDKPFDLVLMDMQMPVMDGLEATRAIRACGISAQTLPILALTANAYADDIAACLAAGMQAHIPKPVQLAGLGAVIRRWTRTEPPRATTDVQSAEMAVPAGLRVRYEARKAELVTCAQRIIRMGTFDDDVIAELRGLLHKLAGSAGMFEEAELGAEAGRLEDALELCPSRERPALLDEVLEALERSV